MGSEEPVCPSCGQPVEMVVRRHKTLGAWVPVWVPGPCRNPKCEAYADKGAEDAQGAEGARHGEDTAVTAPEGETGKTAAKNS